MQEGLDVASEGCSKQPKVQEPIQEGALGRARRGRGRLKSFHSEMDKRGCRRNPEQHPKQTAPDQNLSST